MTGLENVYFYGGGSNASNTGNELHVGGIKGGDNGVWQGKTGDTVNNKVAYVGRFDKVVLHSVKWDKDVAALEATTVENVKTLDIKDLKFDKTPANGESMALLKSGSNLSAITLTYEGGANKTITPAGIIVKDGSGEQTEATGVNGVKLTTKGGSEKVSLPDVNTILYSFEAGKVKGITFGTFDLSKEARELSGSVFEEGNTVDAADLSFADTASILKKNDSVTLVSNASGMATAVANNTGKTIAIKDYEDAQKIKYTATATGDVTSDGTAVKYTVSSVTLNSVDLGGWAGTTAAVPESWTAGDKSVTVNNADAITVTPTAMCGWTITPASSIMKSTATGSTTSRPMCSEGHMPSSNRNITAARPSNRKLSISAKTPSTVSIAPSSALVRASVSTTPTARRNSATSTMPTSLSTIVTTFRNPATARATRQSSTVSSSSKTILSTIFSAQATTVAASKTSTTP